jgi:hypothetical protein
MSAIQASWEAEIRRLTPFDYPREKVHKTPSPKSPQQNGLEVWVK